MTQNLQFTIDDIKVDKYLNNMTLVRFWKTTIKLETKPYDFLYS